LHWQQGNNQRVREHLTSYLHAHCHVYQEDRATPLIILVSDSSVYSVSNFPLHRLVYFCPIQKTKATKNIKFRTCHSLDRIIFQFLVAGHFSLAYFSVFCVSSSRSFETSIFCSTGCSLTSLYTYLLQFTSLRKKRQKTRKSNRKKRNKNEKKRTAVCAYKFHLWCVF
jgi:hypothetical protein